MSKIITATCIGHFGRFGNSLFQYAYARAYAESIGAELHTPDWIGRQLFEGIDEPIREASHFERTEHPGGHEEVDLYGYFQRPEHVGMLSRAKLKEWFRPKPEWKRNGHDLVFHLRHGDYERAGCYALVKDGSYRRACRAAGYDEMRACVYSDERPQDKQYDDFFEIMASKVIFRSNSTYSWWAAALSDAKIYSPVVEDRTGWIDCEFVEGNHPRLVYMFGDLQLKP